MHTHIPDLPVKIARTQTSSKPILLLGKSAISAIEKPGRKLRTGIDCRTSRTASVRARAIGMGHQISVSDREDKGDQVGDGFRESSRKGVEAEVPEFRGISTVGWDVRPPLPCNDGKQYISPPSAAITIISARETGGEMR